MKHAGLQYCIVSGKSANTEKEEAIFTSIKTDAKSTSIFHSDQLVSNIIIRLQVREILNNENVDKKLHACEEGGAHLRISFWYLLINLKNK